MINTLTRRGWLRLTAGGLACLPDAPGADASPPPQLDYHPQGMSMWDAWFVTKGNEVHAFHLQRLAPGSTRPQSEADSLGHAVSRDLLHWQEQPVALPPGPPGSLDDSQPYTGCTIEHAGAYYMFYTMRQAADGGRRQRLGLATSRDLTTWRRLEQNPIIEPDPRWYASAAGRPDPGGVVDCRDMVVIPEPGRTKSWLGFYATRLAGKELGEGGAIAAVRSKDLVHWDHLPPAFTPSRYACVEVPEVFESNGRWYMMCLAAHDYGNRGIFPDPAISRGTVYAVAERPQGPYREMPRDHLLMGGDVNSGYTCRLAHSAGERYVLYIQPVPGGAATLSPPMLVRTLPGGESRLAWAPRNEARRKRQLLGGPASLPEPTLLPNHPRWTMPSGTWTRGEAGYTGKAKSGWPLASVGIVGAALEFEADVTLVRGVATGVAFGPLSPDGRSKDLLFLLDVEAQAVRCLERPWLPVLASRNVPLQTGRKYRLRLSVRPPRAELYLDDILTLQLPVPVFTQEVPGIGLLVDRGEAILRQPKAWLLG